VQIKINKVWFSLLIFLFLTSCSGNKKKTEPAVSQPVDAETTDVPVIEADTLAITEPVDSLEIIPADTVYVDEFFDDFIFNYATDERLRMKRTVSPLPYYLNDTTLRIDREDWVIDTLFFSNDYYTLLIDHDDELEIPEQTTPSSVQVEWYYREPFEAIKYYFEKINGRWMLEGVHARPIVEGMNDDFIKFFFRFSTDSVYQAKHIHQPLIFVTTDPDDDFAIIETTLDLNQWDAFKPILPEDVFSNINYGQHNDDNSSHKIVQLKGIGNGFLNSLFFRRKDNSWELYKFEDTSN